MKRICGAAGPAAGGTRRPHRTAFPPTGHCVRSYGWGSSYFGPARVGLTGIAMSPVALDTAAEFGQIDRR